MRQVLPLVCILLIGCGGSPDVSEVAQTVSDSAGIRIVTAAPLSSWDAQVELTEILRIGAIEGPEELLFSRIAGGKILNDGRIALADAGSREVRQYTSDGTFLKSHGREGEGPGEYEFIIGMGACAPTGFTVFDIGWTMSSYDENGDFVEEQATRLEGVSTPYHLACDTDGRIAAINWDLNSGPQLGFHAAMARLRLLAADGDEIADLGERIGSERFGRPSGSAPHPAGRSTRFGFQDGDLIVSDGSFLGFERWDPSGNLKEIVRIDTPPPDLDSLMAAYMEWSLDRARDEETRRRWRQEIAAMDGPDRASFSSGLFISMDHILIREPTVGQSGRWFEFRQDGTPVGFLPLPPGAQLLDFRGDRVLITMPDEYDAPVAVLYSVTKYR